MPSTAMTPIDDGVSGALRSCPRLSNGGVSRLVDSEARLRLEFLGRGLLSGKLTEETRDVNDEREYMRVPGIVKMFGVSRTQVWNWLRDGLLTRYKPNGNRSKLTLVSVSEMRALIADGPRSPKS
jgi:hypothetical protein